MDENERGGWNWMLGNVADVGGIWYYVTRVVSQSNLRVSSQFKGVSLGNSEFGAKPAQRGAENPCWGLVSASATNHPIVLPRPVNIKMISDSGKLSS